MSASKRSCSVDAPGRGGGPGGRGVAPSCERALVTSTSAHGPSRGSAPAGAGSRAARARPSSGACPTAGAGGCRGSARRRAAVARGQRCAGAAVASIRRSAAWARSSRRRRGRRRRAGSTAGTAVTMRVLRSGSGSTSSCSTPSTIRSRSAAIRASAPRRPSSPAAGREVRRDVDEAVRAGEEVLAAGHLAGVERQPDDLRADVGQVAVRRHHLDLDGVAPAGLDRRSSARCRAACRGPSAPGRPSCCRP